MPVVLVELLAWRDYIYTIKRLIVCMSKSGSESHFKLEEISAWLLVVGQIQYDVVLPYASFGQYEIDWGKKTMVARINQMGSTWRSGGAFSVIWIPRRMQARDSECSALSKSRAQY